MIFKYPFFFAHEVMSYFSFFFHIYWHSSDFNGFRHISSQYDWCIFQTWSDDLIFRTLIRFPNFFRMFFKSSEWLVYVLYFKCMIWWFPFRMIFLIFFKYWDLNIFLQIFDDAHPEYISKMIFLALIISLIPWFFASWNMIAMGIRTLWGFVIFTLDLV